MGPAGDCLQLRRPRIRAHRAPGGVLVSRAARPERTQGRAARARAHARGLRARFGACGGGADVLGIAGGRYSETIISAL